MASVMARAVAGLVRHTSVARSDAVSRSVARSDGASRFVGRSIDLGWGRVYGGQTMAQALAAAQEVAGPERPVHQLSCHFLRPGDVDLDVELEAEVQMQGRSFMCVHVRALQHEKPILLMTTSMQTPEEGIEHQSPAAGAAALRPEWRSPAELQPLEELMAPHLQSRVPRRLRALFEPGRSPFEIRPTEAFFPWEAAPRPPRRAMWLRARAELPDERGVHDRILTYLSDWGLLETGLQPHDGLSAWSPELQVASLNHSVHFHRPFRLDTEWHCHVTHSPVSHGGRCFVNGEIWSERGELVASTAQEGLTRVRGGDGSSNIVQGVPQALGASD